MKKSLGAQAIVGPAPVWIICAYGENNNVSAMAVSWCGISSSIPPCVTICIRESRYTYQALMLQKAFTVNILADEHAKHVDYLGIYSGAKENKLESLNFTDKRSACINAPYIDESVLVAECKVIDTFSVGSHISFVGEIVNVMAEERVLNHDNLPDIEKIKPIIYAPGTSTYHGIGAFIGKAFSVGLKHLNGGSE